jgi:hypothetical protein
MSIRRWGSTIVAGAAMLGVSGLGSVASAADMPIKAPPPPPVFELDVHGFVDLSFKNDYITPRGLLVTNTGLTTQALMGLVLDLYKDKGGFINVVSVYGGWWADTWSKQNHPTARNLNEVDWFLGVSVKFAQNWKFGVEYSEFISPPGNFRTEQNVEFSLAYDDSGWNPFIPFNPYVKLFYAANGSSTVVVGKPGGTYDVEIGIVPTIDLSRTGIPIPVTLSIPTWVTVGPTEYWNSGFFNNPLGTGNRGCGAGLGAGLAFCSKDNVGVFSTGLTGKSPLAFIPKRLGNWYAKYGFQYYNIINDNLRLAQTVVGTAPNFASSHRDVWVGFGGIGFGF